MTIVAGVDFGTPGVRISTAGSARGTPVPMVAGQAPHRRHAVPDFATSVARLSHAGADISQGSL